MTLHLNAHPALGLGAESSMNPRAVSASAPAGSPGAFAGVLGAQAERYGGGAHHGNAFDVPAARREPAARPATAGGASQASASRSSAERAQVERSHAERNRAARAEAERRPQAPPQASNEAEASPAQRRNAAAGERAESARAASRKGAAGEADAASSAGAVDGNTAIDPPVAETAAGAETPEPGAAAAVLPGDASPVSGQPVLEWLARFERKLAAADRPLGDAGVVGGAALAAGGRSPDEVHGDAAPGLAGNDAVLAGTSSDARLAPSAAAATHTELMKAAAASSASAATAAAGAASGEGSAPGTQASPLSALTGPSAAQTSGGSAAAPASAAGGAPMFALPTPVDSPDFGASLAARLTLLAQGGVQQAQLQLNPAEMGPITVQIALDGAQAQIDFSAAHAGTREALAASLPALAAALHGAGLTLTGGGVSEQRSGGQESSSGEGGTASGAGGEADAGEPAAPGSAALPGGRGLLDLYA